MKAFRKIIALMLVVMMVSAFAVTTASAKAVVDKFEVVEFGIFNEAGTAADTLAANKTITVKATLQRVKGENNVAEKATVYAAVYSGKELVDVQGSTKTYTFAGTTQENDLTLTIPAGKTDLTFKAFLWDGSKIMPLAKPSDEAEITGITIGGVAVDNFDTATTTYTVSLPAGTADKPKVAVKATSFIDADVSYNEDNNVATVTVGDAAYTINYTISDETVNITNATLYYGSVNASLANTIDKRYVLKEAPEALRTAADTVGTKDVAGNSTASTETIKKTAGDITYDEYTNLVSIATADSTNPCSFFYNIPDELIGLNYIPILTKAQKAVDNSTLEWKNASGYIFLTFTIDRDTDFYFITSNKIKDISSSDGGAYTTPASFTVTKDLKFFRAYYNESYSQAWNSDYGSLSKYTLSGCSPASEYYKTTLSVPEGKETATFTIKTTKTANFAPPYMYKVHDDGNGDASITDITYTSHLTSGGYTYTETSHKETVGDKEVTFGAVALGDVKSGLDKTKFASKTTTLKEAYGFSSYTELDKYFTGAVSNRYPYWFYTTMPDKFVGMKQILIPYDSYINASTADSIKLTTDKDISVYIGSQLEYCDEGAVNEGEYTFAFVSTDISNSSAANHPNNITLEKLNEEAAKKTFTTPIYRYDIIVPEGEMTATATFKIQTPKNGTYPIIFYETID